MAANTCRECRNIIRDGETHCWRHGGRSAAELDAIKGDRGSQYVTPHDVVEARRAFDEVYHSPEGVMTRRGPSLSLPMEPVARDALRYAEAGVSPPTTARAAVAATAAVLGRPTVSRPALAAKHRAKVRQIAKEMAAALGPGRVELVRVQGLTRFAPGMRRQRSQATSHEVIVVDRNTDDATLIDPFVSALAPVPRSKALMPVVRSGAPGMTISPFADELWVGPPGEYTDNGFMRWDSAEVVDAH